MKLLKFIGFDKQTGDMLELREDDMVFYNKRLGRFRSFYDSHVLRLQFIGLRDKHGKEIYEGYIIRVNGINNLYVVVPWYGGWYLEDKDGVIWKGIFDLHEEDLEVVGDVFKNPELLHL